MEIDELKLIVALLLGFTSGVIVVGCPLTLIILEDRRRWRRVRRLQKDFDGQQWD